MRVACSTQGTSDWLEARCGLITASRVADVMAVLKRKEGESAARANYRTQLMAERLTQRAEDHYVSPEMDWGSEYESQARAEYEVATGSIVDRTGFVLHPTYDFAGASPDGLVAPDGMIEIKCPKTTTHLRWLKAGVVPLEHQCQMLWGMICCERKWCDFISFDPRLPEPFQLFVKRMNWEFDDAEKMQSSVGDFNVEIQTEIESLAAKAMPLKEKLKRSIEIECGITDADLPDWYRKANNL